MSDSEKRLTIYVRPAAPLPQQWPVRVRLDASLLAAADAAGAGAPFGALHCVEDGDVAPFQLDDAGDGAADLTFLLPNSVSAGALRTFRLHTGRTHDTQPPHAWVEVIDGVTHEGQEGYRIATPAATYIYHKQGAGFASLYDADGADWLSYRPWGGSDGKYRGIPNLVYPESIFHPGNTESTSRLVAVGPVKAMIQSESNDGEWACQWDVYPSFARLTVLRAGHPYWFLYEGTPGGKLDEAGDYVVRAPGVRTSAAERWDGRLPVPRWVYFGAAGSNRALYLVHHEDDGETDSYWPMEGNMTVFGFGRLGLASSLTKTPAQFTVGFADVVPAVGSSTDVRAAIRAAYEPLTVEVALSQ